LKGCSQRSLYTTGFTQVVCSGEEADDDDW
jgi:hypothetical protein